MSLDYSSPGISFDLKNGRIFVYKTTAEAIGHPEYARFMFSPEDRVFGNQYHQLCWWSVFAPPGLTGAFPPKGGSLFDYFSGSPSSRSLSYCSAIYFLIVSSLTFPTVSQ